MFSSSLRNYLENLAAATHGSSRLNCTAVTRWVAFSRQGGRTKQVNVNRFLRRKLAHLLPERPKYGSDDVNNLAVADSPMKSGFSAHTPSFERRQRIS